MTRQRIIVLAIVIGLATAGLYWVWASSREISEVVVFSALDSEFSRPVLVDFQHSSGIPVRAKFDIESTKTVGLYEAIKADALTGRTHCDVFWNNEILNTLRLERKGLLERYESPAAKGFPDRYRSADGNWCAFAARARILIVNTQLTPPDQWPKSVLDLADPKWRGKVGIAKPLFGTTATHAACLFAVWGEKRAKDFFLKLKPNVEIESGNKQVADRVAAGELAFGLTDTDDAMGVLRAGHPVAIIYPDQQPGGMGTLFIPNTLAIIRGTRHQAEARRLVDYLLSAEVEKRLAEGESAQIPLRVGLSANLPREIQTPDTVYPMPIDFQAAANAWDETAKFLREEFTAP